MKSLPLALGLTSLLLGLADAASVPPAAAAAAAAASPAPRKSSFSVTTTRDPFWPIGWKRPDPTSKTGDEVEPALSANLFALTSVATGGGTRFAILNGKVVQQGQHFGLQSGSQIYQLTVQSVEDGRVVLHYSGGDIVVPLRRH